MPQPTPSQAPREATIPPRTPAEPASAIPSMYTPSQLRQLKFAVIAMGVILLLGFAAVIGRILYLVNSQPRTAGQAAVASGPPLAGKLPPLSLPKGAVIRHMALSGSRLVIQFEAEGGRALRILDLDKGGPGITVPIVDDASPSR